MSFLAPYSRFILNAFISLALVFSFPAASQSVSSNNEEPEGNVELPPDDHGRIEQIGEKKWHIDFEEPANETEDKNSKQGGGGSSSEKAGEGESGNEEQGEIRIGGGSDWSRGSSDCEYTGDWGEAMCESVPMSRGDVKYYEFEDFNLMMNNILKSLFNKKERYETQNQIKKIGDETIRQMLKWGENTPRSVEDEAQWLEEGQRIFKTLRENFDEEEWRIESYFPSAQVEEAREALLKAIETPIYRSYVYGKSNKIGVDVLQEIKNLIFGLSQSNSQKGWTAEDVTSQISQIEPLIRRAVQNPDIELEYPQTAINSLETKDIQAIIQEQEIKVYRNALRFMKEHYIKNLEQGFNSDINSLSEDVETITSGDDQFDINTAIGPSSYEAYQNNVTKPVHDVFRLKYSREELSLIGNKELSKDLSEPYEFISPEGEFLDKNKALYEKLNEANPYHEQGVRAREIGLTAVETADEEYAEGNTATAETAFQVGEAMSDIALGALPYVGVGKDIYELFTGKHLLTGRTLTGFERGMSVVGIGLSTFSGGVFSSGSVKLALHQSSRVFSKINQKLIDKYYRGLGGGQFERIVKAYPEAFLQTIEEIGITSLQGVKTGLKFVRRAFAGDNPSVKKFQDVLQRVGKTGIDDYAKALDELKSSPQKLYTSGEEFLARQLRFKKEIFEKTGVHLNTNDLVRMGKSYAKTSLAFDGVPRGSFKGQIWRGGDKRFIEEANLFKFHRGMDSSIARYTVGRRAIYSSLKEETTIKELMEQTGLETPAALRKTHHIKQSKEIDLDSVLDLNNSGVREYLRVSKKSITTQLEKGVNPRAYEQTQIIGDIAKKRGFKAILAPSAVEGGEKNLISFVEF